MAEYIEREAAIVYIREQSEECQKAFEELGGESGIYADAYNDLAEDFYSIPAADVAPVVRGKWEFLGPNNLIKECMCGTCSVCKVRSKYIVNTMLCPNCGAKMDGGDNDAAD